MSYVEILFILIIWRYIRIYYVMITFIAKFMISTQWTFKTMDIDRILPNFLQNDIVSLSVSRKINDKKILCCALSIL
jgi:hypothetical protein